MAEVAEKVTGAMNRTIRVMICHTPGKASLSPRSSSPVLPPAQKNRGSLCKPPRC